MLSNENISIIFRMFSYKFTKYGVNFSHPKNKYSIYIGREIIERNCLLEKVLFHSFGEKYFIY